MRTSRGCPQVNKLEQVSSNDHQMSVARGGRSYVCYLGEGVPKSQCNGYIRTPFPWTEWQTPVKTLPSCTGEICHIFRKTVWSTEGGRLAETPPRFANAYLWSLSMLLYNTRTRRTWSIPLLVLIVCRSRSRLVCSIETGWFFLVVSFSQCHRCKDVSTSPSGPLPIHILCYRSYILCNNRNIIVYVKAPILSLSLILSRKIMSL